MSALNLTPEEPVSAGTQAQNNYETIAQAKSGANWFYWIAGLSLVNSAIFLFGGNWSFFAGLGITQIIDAVGLGATEEQGISAIKLVLFAINAIIAGGFIFCGIFANRFQTWAFVVGMIFYTLDGVLLLILGAYLPVAFHIFALFMMFRGLSAARQVNTQ